MYPLRTLPPRLPHRRSDATFQTKHENMAEAIAVTFPNNDKFKSVVPGQKSMPLGNSAF